MNIFLSLCNKCDQVKMDDVTKLLPIDDKVTTVDCKSCGNRNSVLMFTIAMPEPPEDDKNSGDKNKSPMPPSW